MKSLWGINLTFRFLRCHHFFHCAPPCTSHTSSRETPNVSAICAVTSLFPVLPFLFVVGSMMSNARPSPQSASAYLRDSHPPLRSCTFCRHRKIKCDRQQPCCNCVRGGRGTECVYPAGPGRRPKRPRQLTDARVFNRLDRLETIIEHLSSRPSARSESNSDQRRRAVDESTVQVVPGSSQDVPIEQQLGRLVIDDTRSYYVGNLFWASLGKEVCWNFNYLPGM